MNIVRRSRPGREIPSGPVGFLSFSHRLVNDEADGVRRHPAHPLGGMGVGVQDKPGGVVAQGVGQGLHIHPVCQGVGCECVPQISLRQAPTKNFLKLFF